MNEPSDQAARESFIRTYGKNISVIAPAGVGKTKAIVERIAGMAKPAGEAADRLSRLVVVTYSVRAAQQMQQRARVAMREAGVPRPVQRAFQQTFFGTIHSYCVLLLERFGHYLGLPSPVGLLQDHNEWWNRFLTRGLNDEPVDENLLELFHFYPPEKLYALGREVSPEEIAKTTPSPKPDLRKLLAYSLDGLHSSTKRSLGNAQEEASRWSEAWARGDRFYPLPKCPETKQTAFVELWATTFGPLHRWLRDSALQFGRRVANSYEAFRLDQAVMTYDDQVRLALRLLKHPAVQAELAEERPSVLLDEAQDTDPRQFEVLLRVAGLIPGTEQPQDQSFCIVGDFQQAIYAPRSNLSVYQKVHDNLVVEPRGSSSTLEVTFRCDEEIIRFVNHVFPGALHGRLGQSEFYKLSPRSDAGKGQVARWSCPDEPTHAVGAKVRADVRARHEAQFLAEQIATRGYAGLGADSWAEVAILCPRRNWLVQIVRELNARNIPVQFHSSDETQNDRTPGTWLTALIWVVAHPEDSFEVAGVLREIFGVSDHDMAHFTKGDGDALRLDGPAGSQSGPVPEAMQLLRQLIKDVRTLPLHQAVERILKMTKLRERLQSIMQFELENAARDLDDFVAAILRRAADGATLAQLAHELRLGLTQGAKVEEESREAIQLMTSHKAKGLEWQTVIVPYMFRAIESKTPAYPRLVYMEDGKEMILRDKADYASQAKDFVSERERQQLQRLLYVTCTRAKHTLLLIDDEALFDGQMQRGGWSSADLLGFLGGVNRIHWAALPQQIVTGDSKARVEAEKKLEEKLPTLLTTADISRALSAARSIPRRTTPHELAVHPPTESEPETNLDREEVEIRPDPRSPGILYGTWWHEFVQALPWSEARGNWQRHFDRAQVGSPQPERSRQEWELFCDSALADWLREPGRVIQSEIPFLWREKAEDCLEGIIDLAVFTPADGTWRIIDWKTNRVESGLEADLIQIYRGQIEAYVRAVSRMLSAPVTGSIYITASGDWVPVC